MTARRHGWLGVALAVATAVAAGCDGGDEPAPAFPADYAATYVEVRGCRGSADHDLRRIRVLADPAALAPYQTRSAPFPPGAIVLKAEHDFADDDCTGPVVEWTVMTRLAAGTAPGLLDWSWQRVDGDRRVVSEDEPRCAGCHADCGGPPDGHDGTCAVP